MNQDHTLADPIENSLEHMQDMKAALLNLQGSPDDTAVASALPCVLRAILYLDSVHGCKHIVEFTSMFENVLARVREAELLAEANVLSTLISSCDHISDMVSQLAKKNKQPISQ
jgi:chemotaxis protein histidine kinase CheA